MYDGHEARVPRPAILLVSLVSGIEPPTPTFSGCGYLLFSTTYSGTSDSVSLCKDVEGEPILSRELSRARLRTTWACSYSAAEPGVGSSSVLAIALAA
jgi:hypothetical protein